MRLARRDGFSLLEVILATAIFMGCVIVLGQLASLGSRTARAALELSEAQRLCQNRVEEILAGTVPLEPVQGEPLPDHPGWVVTVQVDPLKQPGLVGLRVRVDREDRPEQAGGGAGAAAGGVHMNRSPRGFTLCRWLAMERAPRPEVGVPSGAAPIAPPPTRSRIEPP